MELYFLGVMLVHFVRWAWPVLLPLAAMLLVEWLTKRKKRGNDGELPDDPN